MASRSSSGKQHRTLNAQVFNCSEGFFAKYKMATEAVLGRGMSGQVVLASSQDDPDDKRAVKVFTKNAINMRQFYMETAVIQTLDHPHVLPDVMAFQCPDSYVLCMPYYPGGSLASHLPRMRLAKVAKYFLQLASAVLHLHANSIVHRDIKPDNVMLDEDDDVILIDFGLSLGVAFHGQASVRPGGTPVYMPPELYAQDRVDYFKCDTFALGGVLWNMLFGRLARHPNELLLPLDHTCQFPTVYKIFLKNLLHPDPKQRWGDKQLAFALSQLPVKRD